jgi:hypothetical protein|tara:strand:+ start:248 stop:403 length:156 start_codon:yes stop_codon:yes gene_type:complete
MKKTLHERLILRSIQLDKVALRDPMSPKQLRDRINWERVKKILNKRYENKD